MVSILLLIVFFGVALMLIRDLAPEPMGKYLRVALLVFLLLVLAGAAFGGWEMPMLHQRYR